MGIQEWKDPHGEKAGSVFAGGEGEQVKGSWCCGCFVAPCVLHCVLSWVLPVALREPGWDHQVGWDRASWMEMGPLGHHRAGQSSRTCSYPPSLGIHWDELSELLCVAVTVLGTAGD